jgi:hypothetical protein
MEVGKYLRTSADNKAVLLRFRRLLVWGEEGRKLFTFLKNVYPSSSLAQNVEKKRLGLRFSGMSLEL